MSTTESLIQQQIADSPVILYMKGTPQFPQCGFSSQVTKILKSLGVEFAHVNILEHPDIRETIKVVSNWPTFPQLYVKGELVGGCDIVTEMYETGELESLLKPVSADNS